MTMMNPNVLSVCVCKCVRIYDSRNTRWSDHVVNVYASKVLAHVFLLTTNKSITLFGQLNEFDCICNFNWTWFSPPFTYFKCSTEKKSSYRNEWADNVQHIKPIKIELGLPKQEAFNQIHMHIWHVLMHCAVINEKRKWKWSSDEFRFFFAIVLCGECV